MKRSEARRPSMADVALRARVSHQTVSRVVNDNPHVRESTRKRVLDAIDELGYSRNSAARALVTQRSATIGLVASGTTLYGPVSALVSLEQAARRHGYFLSITTLSSFGRTEVQDAMDHFRSQMVEGIAVIVPTYDVSAVVDHLRGIPAVLITSDEEDRSGLPTVGIDQRAGATMVVDLLADLGHTRIAHVAGPLDNFDALLRTAGWRDALSGRGLAIPPVYLGSWSSMDGYAAGREIVDAVRAGGRRAPTAVFVANDHMAMGVLRAVHEAGLRVPEDLSVVGFDDLMGADCLLPPLTTVRQPFDQLGMRAMEAMLQLLDGETCGDVRLPPLLVERESHGAPRGAPGPRTGLAAAAAAAST